MRVQKKVNFLVPYLNSVKDLIPLHRIDHIKGYRLPKTRRASQYGSCLKDQNGRFTINMRLWRYDNKCKQYLGLYLGHILETFAHEIAHTIPGCFDHSPKHMRYTGIILTRFEKVLKKQGIKDCYKTRMHYE